MSTPRLESRPTNRPAGKRAPVRTATATIAQMEGLIEDLVKIKEAGRQGSSSCCTSIAGSREDVQLTPRLSVADSIARRGSTSSSSGDEREGASVLRLQREVKDLTEKVRFQQVLIEGLRTKQALMEEKEKRLKAKASLFEEQQKEIQELRAKLVKQRQRNERRSKEESDRRRHTPDGGARKENRREHERRRDKPRHPPPAQASAPPDICPPSDAVLLSAPSPAPQLHEREGGSSEKGDSGSGGSAISVISNASSSQERDGEQRGPSERGKKAKERLKNLIGGSSAEQQKNERIAIVREDFERKDEMLKRVVERLNADTSGGGGTSEKAKTKTKTKTTSRDSVGEGSDIRRVRNERRSQIINEFITTEESYLHNLRTIVEVYMTPLRDALLNGTEILSSEEMETLFSRDITMMHTLHATLLNELKNAATFTSALTSFVPYLKIYTQYVNNFPQAMQLLTQKTARSKRFAEFIKERQEVAAASERQDSAYELGKTNEMLSSLLVMPIQRLPRYELLIKDILKCTPPDSPHAKELETLLLSVQEVNTHVNESKRKEENTQKLSIIQKGLVGHGDLSLFDRIGRKFIAEGRMGARLVLGKGGSANYSKWRKVKGADRQPPPFSRHLIFLFDDLLLETKQVKEREFKFKHAFLVDAISIDNYDGSDEDFERIFVITDEEDGRVLHLKADSVHEKLEWMQAISKQIDVLQLEAQEPRLSISC